MKKKIQDVFVVIVSIAIVALTMSIFRCCIDGCNNTREDAVFHYFPKRENKLAQWLDCINSQELRASPRGRLYHLVVCQSHFERRFIKRNSRLRIDAYPSLFTPEEISSGLPQTPSKNNSEQDFQPTVQTYWDHTYCKIEKPIPECGTNAASTSKSSEPATNSTTDSALFVEQLTRSQDEALAPHIVDMNTTTQSALSNQTPTKFPKKSFSSTYR